MGIIPSIHRPHPTPETKVNNGGTSFITNIIANAGEQFQWYNRSLCSLPDGVLNSLCGHMRSVIQTAIPTSDFASIAYLHQLLTYFNRQDCQFWNSFKTGHNVSDSPHPRTCKVYLYTWYASLKCSTFWKPFLRLHCISNKTKLQKTQAKHWRPKQSSERPICQAPGTSQKLLLVKIQPEIFPANTSSAYHCIL